MNAKLSDAQRRASQKWDAENLKRLSLAMLKTDFDEMSEHIERIGENRNRFINRAIKRTIAEDRATMNEK